jgi:hypothetical protein
MGRLGNLIYLRPLKGGIEWSAPSEDVEEITTGVALGVALTEERRRSEAFRAVGGWNSGAVL